MTKTGKSLIVLFCIVGAIAFLRPVWGPQYDGFYSGYDLQMKHLRQVESHIETIRPQWYAFTNGNAGFAMVELYAYTGGDGLFGASGYVESEDHLLQLRTFMEQTAPPRPIALNVAVIGPDYMQLMRKQKVEPDGPANGNQPSRSETNSTSSSAGSHR